MPDCLTLTRPQAGYPPVIHGTAQLAALAFQGCPLAGLLERIGPPPEDTHARAGWLMDRSLAHALTFQAEAAAALQAEALAIGRVFRLRGAASGLRLLAVMAPGDLMVNAPLDFLTQATDIRLDLAFTTPDGALPIGIPAHDVAIVAVGESTKPVLAALPAQFVDWPCPVLNDPAHIALLSRDGMAQALAGSPYLAIAPTVQVTRAALRREALEALLPGGVFPVLLRPLDSHGGKGLVKIESDDDVAMFLLTSGGDRFYLTQFIDYRGADGWFRKYRIAFAGGAPFLCHMAASEHWMVHYVNAGMAESAEKRAAEAMAMAEFDTGFAQRHSAAFAAICAVTGLDYFSIDCGEAPDGRLLVFEVDVAAIIHSLDDPVVYPYKREPMQRCYDGFAAMLQTRVGVRNPRASDQSAGSVRA